MNFENFPQEGGGEKGRDGGGQQKKKKYIQKVKAIALTSPIC